jgi:hypothetical protein
MIPQKKMLDAGCSMLDAGCSMLGLEPLPSIYSIQDNVFAFSRLRREKHFLECHSIEHPAPSR